VRSDEVLGAPLEKQSQVFFRHEISACRGNRDFLDRATRAVAKAVVEKNGLRSMRWQPVEDNRRELR
jgi:hypothetical protein